MNGYCTENDGDLNVDKRLKYVYVGMHEYFDLVYYQNINRQI